DELVAALIRIEAGPDQERDQEGDDRGGETDAAEDTLLLARDQHREDGAGDRQREDDDEDQIVHGLTSTECLTTSVRPKRSVTRRTTWCLPGALKVQTASWPVASVLPSPSKSHSAWAPRLTAPSPRSARKRTVLPSALLEVKSSLGRVVKKKIAARPTIMK